VFEKFTGEQNSTMDRSELERAIDQLPLSHRTRTYSLSYDPPLLSSRCPAHPPLDRSRLDVPYVSVYHPRWGCRFTATPSTLDHRQRSPSLMTRWCPPLPHATTRSSLTLRHRHHSPLWCPPPNLIHRQPLIQRGRSHMIRSHGRVFDRNFGCIFG
jgi:hypothetical protein